jgi:toxin ParE1/3/4
MSRWRLDPDARGDLKAIYKYIAPHNRTAAARLIDTIKGTLRFLARQPLMGENRQELGPTMRSFTVGNYVVFYRPTRGGIQVARILHAARDVTRVFPRHEDGPDV